MGQRVVILSVDASVVEWAVVEVLAIVVHVVVSMLHLVVGVVVLRVVVHCDVLRLVGVSQVDWEIVVDVKMGLFVMTGIHALNVVSIMELVVVSHVLSRAISVMDDLEVRGSVKVSLRVIDIDEDRGSVRGLVIKSLVIVVHAHAVACISPLISVHTVRVVGMAWTSIWVVLATLKLMGGMSALSVEVVVLFLLNWLLVIVVVLLVVR